MHTLKLTIAVLGLSAMVLLNACKKGDMPHIDPHGFQDNEAVLYWNEKTSIVLTAPFTPPAQCRYFAMVQIAVHDALNSIKPKYECFALLQTKDPLAASGAAVAAATHHIIVNKLQIQGTHPMNEWYQDWLSKIPDGDSKQRGIALGVAAAEAIFAKRSTDNFETANFQGPGPDGVAPGEYRSTLPFSLPVFPAKPKPLAKWSTLTPFVIESSTQFRVEPPYPVTSSEYTADYNEVKAKGGRAVHTRTEEEDQIGRFWVERSSIGWNRLARTLIQTKKIDAWKTARLLALLHTAMTDGTITNFESKYHYFYWRPETAIRLGNDDGNSATTGDPSWLPSYTESPNPANEAMNVNTPPIPDYPSAHANFGAAAGEVLRLFFGTDKIAVDLTSPTAPGIKRRYTTLSSAIRDNSLSRIYVGYHFRKAVLAGEEQGIKVGNYVFNHAFRENQD